MEKNQRSVDKTAETQGINILISSGDYDKIIKEKRKNKALQWGNALFLGLNL